MPEQLWDADFRAPRERMTQAKCRVSVAIAQFCLQVNLGARTVRERARPDVVVTGASWQLQGRENRAIRGAGAAGVAEW